MNVPTIVELDASKVVAARFDVGIWAAGFEERSQWLVGSRYKPQRVSGWHRVEFLEHRAVHSSESAIYRGFGTLVGDGPAHVGDDGHWLVVWRRLLRERYAHYGRPLRLFVDYSSMPRTVYGTLLVECMRSSRALIESVTMAYVPGSHAVNVEGSRVVEGLRGLVGTEGASRRSGATAFILGLGYDGAMVEAVVDLFQISHFSCFYGDPGVLPDSVLRVLTANSDVIDASDVVETAPAHSIGAAMTVVLKLHNWYAERRDVLVVPLGPKPHVVGALLAAAIEPSIGFRFPSGQIIRPVQVTVKDNTVPFFSRISFAVPNSEP